MKIFSFKLTGQFAAFRDPSVTSNQTVYYIPSKSALVGLLGAMIGVERDDNSLGPLYGENYINFFSKVKIGIKHASEPRKITFFTNHRSFEKTNMKPYKKELVENPEYRIYVLIDSKYQEFRRIKTSISQHRFAYSPYLGHAYCPATISNPRMYESEETNPVKQNTSCVILDESDSYKSEFRFRISPVSEKSAVMIETHLLHYYVDNRLERRVLRHWIPVNSSLYRIDRDDRRELSKFYKVDDQVVCMY